jgi:hypothetical protein
LFVLLPRVLLLHLQKMRGNHRMMSAPADADCLPHCLLLHCLLLLLLVV